jgi:hypothetical protein
MVCCLTFKEVWERENSAHVLAKTHEKKIMQVVKWGISTIHHACLKQQRFNLSLFLIKA